MEMIIKGNVINDRKQKTINGSFANFYGLLTAYRLPLTAFLYLLLLTAFFCLPLTTSVFAAPHPKWSAVKKKIAVQTGTSISVWSLPGRADITEKQYGVADATMTAEGDGTYSLGVDLLPGNQYNYIFYAEVDGTTYWDTVLNDGTSSGFLLSMDSNTFVNPGSGSAIYTSISYQGSGDARRLLTVPFVSEGSTVYVLNNFQGAPQVPTSIQGIPGQSSVRLKWNEPATFWGNSGSMRPIDVLLGGGFRVFRSTDKASGYKDIGASLQSSSPTFVSDGLVLGTTASITYEVVDPSPLPNTTNFYIIVSSDAYSGSANIMEIANLTSGVPGPGTQEQVKARTGRPIEIWFKVEGADEEKIKEKDYLVWLTPQDEDGRFYRNKIAGRMVTVYVPEVPSQDLGLSSPSRDEGPGEGDSPQDVNSPFGKVGIKGVDESDIGEQIPTEISLPLALPFDRAQDRPKGEEEIPQYPPLRKGDERGILSTEGFTEPLQKVEVLNEQEEL